MKHTFSILTIALLILSCAENRDTEIIRLSDSDYLSESKLDTPPGFKEPLAVEELESKLKGRYVSKNATD